MEDINYSKVKFYSSYILQKLFFLPFKVKKPRFRFYIYELLYSLLKLYNKNYMLVYPFNDDLILTVEGEFYIRRNTTDAVVVSPAYEYLDKKFLVKTIQDLLLKNYRVLFVDVGTNIGAYPVALYSYLERTIPYLSENLHMLVFEADTENFQFLKKNLERNQVKNTQLYNLAAYSEDGITLDIFHNNLIPGCSYITNKVGETFKIKTVKIDTILKESNYFENFDCIVLKIDVEGLELKVLEGSRMAIENFPRFYLCVESFYRGNSFSNIKNFFDELSSCKFTYKRYTPYNIWIEKVFNFGGKV